MKIMGDDLLSQPRVRPWTIRDIADGTRQSVIRAAKREGMTISQWVNRVLEEQANRTLNPRSGPKGCSSVPVQILDELLTLNRRMDRVERQSAVESGSD